jgi:DNA-binding transcriptional LysR family regulator
MELRQLRYFVVVADELHFTRAAARLGIAQPPLSKQVRRLEQELGVQLFDRTNRRVGLTAVGRAFLIEAQLALAHADRAVDVANDLRKLQTGRLVIGAQATAEVTVLPRLLPRFRKKFPDVKVLLVSPLTPLEQAAMLKDGQLDVGFVRLPIRDPAVVALPILREPLVAALPSRSPLTRRRYVTLRQELEATWTGSNVEARRRSEASPLRHQLPEREPSPARTRTSPAWRACSCRLPRAVCVRRSRPPRCPARCPRRGRRPGYRAPCSGRTAT